MIVGIDVGSHKICTLIGEALPGGETRVIGIGHAPSAGIRHGEVVHVEDAAGAIAASIERAERQAGRDVHRARVGISGLHLAGANNEAFVPCGRRPRVIVREDVDRALEVAGTVPIGEDRSVFHVVPRHFVVDSGVPVDSPLEMEGCRLEAAVHIVTAGHAPLANLKRCLALAEVEPMRLAMSTLAAADAVLTDDERELGVVLLDLGDSVTGLACYSGGALSHTSVLPVGGRHMTNDLGVVLQTPLAEAERIKMTYGHVLPELEQEDVEIEIVPFGEDQRRTVSRRYVSEVLAARADEIATLVAEELDRAGMVSRFPAGVVLVGGGTDLTGMPERIGARLGTPARIGRPQHVVGLSDATKGPGYAGAVGLLRWKGGDPRDIASPFGSTHKSNGSMGKMLDWARAAFLPHSNGRA